MKKCNVEGCNTDINDWDVYCPPHKQQHIQARQQRPRQVFEGKPKIEPNTSLPPSPLERERQLRQSRPKLQPVPELPESLQKEVTKTKPLPEPMHETLRLEIKMVALEQAVRFITTQDVGGEEFSDVIKEIETMTAHFYKIIVGRCEDKV